MEGRWDLCRKYYKDGIEVVSPKRLSYTDENELCSSRFYIYPSLQPPQLYCSLYMDTMRTVDIIFILRLPIVFIVLNHVLRMKVLTVWSLVLFVCLSVGL